MLESKKKPVLVNPGFELMTCRSVAGALSCSVLRR